MIYTADAKLGFDENAQFRQKAIFDMEDTTESDPREVEAASFNLNYVPMDGNIGCLGTIHILRKHLYSTKLNLTT